MLEPERHGLALGATARNRDADPAIVIDSEHVTPRAPVPDKIKLDGRFTGVGRKWQRQLHGDRIL